MHIRMTRAFIHSYYVRPTAYQFGVYIRSTMYVFSQRKRVVPADTMLNQCMLQFYFVTAVEFSAVYTTYNKCRIKQTSPLFNDIWQFVMHVAEMP